MIIDFHAHIYPDRVAEKAVRSIGDFYNIPMRQQGTAEDLIRVMDEAGAALSVVCSAAVDGAHVRKVNDFILSAVRSHPGRLLGFGTLHADMRDPEEEVEYMLKKGLRGVKLHPDMQRFALNDPQCDRLFSACEGRLPMLIHTGDKRFSYSNPTQIPPILEKHPKLTLICAHLGGYSEWDSAADCLKDAPVYVDCSSSFFALTRERAAELICLFGEERVLFGSDFPMWNMKEELQILLSLSLDESMLEKILHKNAERLLGLNE